MIVSHIYKKLGHKSLYHAQSRRRILHSLHLLKNTVDLLELGRKYQIHP